MISQITIYHNTNNFRNYYKQFQFYDLLILINTVHRWFKLKVLNRIYIFAISKRPTSKFCTVKYDHG